MVGGGNFLGFPLEINHSSVSVCMHVHTHMHLYKIVTRTHCVYKAFTHTHWNTNFTSAIY